VNSSLTPNYGALTLDELLRLANQRDDLTDEARLALDAELSRRQVTPEVLAAGRAEMTKFEREQAREVRELSFGHGGIARKLFGKSHYVCDEQHRIEEFQTTLWFVLLWIPIFPIGTFQIRRRFRRWWQFWASERYHVIERLPRDWEQILLTWIKTVAVLLALRLAELWILKPLLYREK
jgi:hypothetical protein